MEGGVGPVSETAPEDGGHETHHQQRVEPGQDLETAVFLVAFGVDDGLGDAHGLFAAEGGPLHLRSRLVEVVELREKGVENVEELVADFLGTGDYFVEVAVGVAGAGRAAFAEGLDRLLRPVQGAGSQTLFPEFVGANGVCFSLEGNETEEEVGQGIAEGSDLGGETVGGLGGEETAGGGLRGTQRRGKEGLFVAEEEFGVVEGFLPGEDT